MTIAYFAKYLSHDRSRGIRVQGECLFSFEKKLAYFLEGNINLNDFYPEMELLVAIKQINCHRKTRIRAWSWNAFEAKELESAKGSESVQKAKQQTQLCYLFEQKTRLVCEKIEQKGQGNSLAKNKKITEEKRLIVEEVQCAVWSIQNPTRLENLDQQQVNFVN